MPEEGDFDKDYIEEDVNVKEYERLKISTKDYNHDYEIIYGEKVYPKTTEKANLEEDMDVDEPKKDNEEKKTKLVDPDTLKVRTPQDTSRQIIGYVTSGGYSMDKGHGIGKGSVELLFLQAIKDSAYVLVRNPSSTKYFKAKIDRFYG